MTLDLSEKMSGLHFILHQEFQQEKIKKEMATQFAYYFTVG